MTTGHEPAAGKGAVREVPVVALTVGGYRLIVTELRAKSRREQVWPMFMAAIHLGLGRRDEAIRLLEQDVARRSPYTVYLRLDPLYAELRGDPRFEAIINRLRMPG